MVIPEIDVVVRFKNEEFWLRKLKAKIASQKGVMVNLIGVDNGSIDNSKKVFQSFSNENLKSLQYTNIEHYTPGNSLNEGADLGSSDFILFLSAHCIPKDDDYFLQMYDALVNESEDCAGIYGRQLPLPCSGAQNTVDLALTYPSENRILRRTPLFNNANSMIRREVYNIQPFDDNVTNLEDLIWARSVQQKNYYLKYTAEAPVYHYHGIHQHKLNSSSDRLSKSLKVLLDSGWLTIDCPAMCEMVYLNFVIYEVERNQYWSTKINASHEFTFTKISNRELHHLQEAIDYIVYIHDEFVLSKLKSFFQTVAEQTSQLSVATPKDFKHNLQDSLSEEEINQILVSTDYSMICVSKALYGLVRSNYE